MHWKGAQSDLMRKIVPLPIDQRYGLAEIARVVSVIEK